MIVLIFKNFQQSFLSLIKGGLMKFSNYLNPDYIFIDLKATTKEEIIIQKFLRKLLKKWLFFSKKRRNYKKHFKREEEISTCMGEGIYPACKNKRF